MRARCTRSAFSVFATVFLRVFLLSLALSVTITLLLPKSYYSDCKVLLRRDGLRVDPVNDATVFSIEEVTAEPVLRLVVEELDLKIRWGDKYTAGMAMDLDECIKLLQSRIEVRALRSDGPNGSPQLLSIGAYSESPREAAEIANALTLAFRRTSQGNGEIIVLDRAIEPIYPARPNKLLNILMGSATGILLGAIVGAMLARKSVKRPQTDAVPPVLR